MFEKKITIKDIAKEVGVSAATVSRVLNYKPSTLISEVTKNAIFKKAHELNYQPNRLAQALVTGTTKTIAIFAFSIRTNYYSHVVSTLNTLIKNDGYEVKIIESDGNLFNIGLNELFVDGIVAFDSINFFSEDITKYGLEQKPTVCVGARYNEKFDYVTCDLYDGAYNLLKHIYETGKRKIALLSPFDVKEPLIMAYLDFTKKHDLEMISINFDEGAGDVGNPIDPYNAVMKHVKENGVNFDCIAAYSDSVALGVNRALHDLNVRIPEDVALTGCDGTFIVNYYVPRLTTIKQPFEDMCETAWNILKERMKDKTIPLKQVKFKAEILKNESTIGSKSN